MLIEGLRITLNSYFRFNFAYACVIALLIFFGLYWFMRKRKGVEGQKVSKKDLFWAIIIAVYIVVLIGGTLLNREVGEKYQMELMPFWSYCQIFMEGNLTLVSQMVYNVLFFIPWSMLFAQISVTMKKFCWGVGSAFVFSVFIEVTQLVFRCGLFEFDDMFHNVLGAVIGYGILSLYKKNSRTDYNTNN